MCMSCVFHKRRDTSSSSSLSSLVCIQCTACDVLCGSQNGNRQKRIVVFECMSTKMSISMEIAWLLFFPDIFFHSVSQLFIVESCILHTHLSRFLCELLCYAVLMLMLLRLPPPPLYNCICNFFSLRLQTFSVFRNRLIIIFIGN